MPAFRIQRTARRVIDVADPISATDADLDATARTIFGEARSEPLEGQQGVAWVIRNRATWPGSPLWWGDGIAGICQKPWQFSCWNANDPNRAKLLALATDDPEYDVLYEIARSIMADEVDDPTGHASHYKVRGTRAEWDAAVMRLGLVPVSIGHHDFYALGPSA
jgi:N-acetylmuramoyl-L-alanine amidase